MCFFAAAQDHRIPGFQTQRGNIHCDIRTRFINHTDHAQRDTAALKTQSAVQHTAVNHFPDRICQLTYFTHISSNAFQARLSQQQTIKHRLRCPLLTGFGNIEFIGSKDRGAVLLQQIGNTGQCPVLLFSGELSQYPGGGFGRFTCLF